MPQRIRRVFIRIATVGVALASVAALAGSALAAAEPGSGSADPGSLNTGSLLSGSTIPKPLQEIPDPPPVLRDDITVPRIVSVEATSPQARRLIVESPALRRALSVEVLLPADTSVPRPTLYLLDGVSARNHTSAWMHIGGGPAFFADKNTNVVMTNGGAGSMYTDWLADDPVLGHNKWETYITEELPPLIDAELGTNGVMAIAGNSMGGQAAVMLAHRHPDLYTGVASYSGCYSTSDLIGAATVRTTVSSQGGDATNMWGPGSNPDWLAHDSIVHAENLRGKDIYLSSATGVPGVHETPQTEKLAEVLVVGGTIEAGSNFCTHTMENRLNSLGIPVTVTYEPTGVHAWGYWRDQLPKSWPTLARALGV